MHADVDVELDMRPKWANTTLQDAGDLVGDPVKTRRTQSDCKEPPLSVTSTELILSRHIFLVWYSYPRSYGEAARNPFWDPPCRRSTTPSLRTKLRIWFPFLQERNLSGADGSTGPREHRMDTLADTNPG
jgi:hypothetical protein